MTASVSNRPPELGAWNLDEPKPVQSVITSRLNADLIAAIAPLWIGGPESTVLDLTYGRGKWWTKYRPEFLTTNDLDPESPADHHYDFLNPPAKWWDAFDVVAFDPPYVSKGGRDTVGEKVKDMDARYGLYDAPKDPEVLWSWIHAGMAAAHDLLTPRGRLLVKCSDFISSGKYHSGYYQLVQSGTLIGFKLADVFVHHSGTGPQPKGRRQVHSRRAHSYLIVFQK